MERTDKTSHKPYGPYEKYIKRPLDIICVMLVFLFFWWLYIIIAMLVYFRLGTPVIFRQQRPGKNEKIFWLYKFRTMTNAADPNGDLLPDTDRLTKFGNWLRSTSLDELPELFNVLKGDMSLIGPRPLLVRYLPYYTAAERHRHDIRPGLTGLAQINGRNFLNWEERFEYDLKYVDHISFKMDCGIILVTVKKVFKRQDILEKNNKRQTKAISFQNLDVERRNMVNTELTQ